MHPTTINTKKQLHPVRTNTLILLNNVATVLGPCRLLINRLGDEQLFCLTSNTMHDGMPADPTDVVSMAMHDLARSRRNFVLQLYHNLKDQCKVVLYYGVDQNQSFVVTIL